MNIELPADAARFVERLVASGQFQSPREAVAEGVRLSMNRQALRADNATGY